MNKATIDWAFLRFEVVVVVCRLKWFLLAKIVLNLLGKCYQVTPKNMNYNNNIIIITGFVNISAHCVCVFFFLIYLGVTQTHTHTHTHIEDAREQKNAANETPLAQSH